MVEQGRATCLLTHALVKGNEFLHYPISQTTKLNIPSAAYGT